MATTYFAFLLFAQFAFLELLQQTLTGDSQVRTAMASMGIAGLATSLWAGWLLRRQIARRLMVSGFLLCAACALAAPPSRSAVALILLAGAIGVAIALLTVSVATSLEALLPAPRRGVQVGVATGVAYFACNFPPVFNAPPASQALVVAAACLVAAILLPPAGQAPRVAERGMARPARTSLPFLAILVCFLSLVWLDSAAFAIIQESVALKGLTWGDPLRLLGIGTAHLAAAMLAGLAIDRGRLQSLLLIAFGLFAASFTILGRGDRYLLLVGPLYAIGISLYSVALVATPVSLRGTLPVRWRAAMLFGIAGWIGSALGVGMAQDLHDIPALFLWVCGGILSAAWIMLHRRSVIQAARGLAPTLAWAAAATAVALAVAPSGSSDRPSSDGRRPLDAIERGRKVYIQEGCISCHSQFVRPGTQDEMLWGPARRSAPLGEPVLIGMRRQGPDLMNAGNRRSVAWHRAHLAVPQALSPGSRMPSYRHLFDTSDGEDLVAYLASLGADTSRQRFTYSQTASVPDSTQIGSPTAGSRLFASNCRVCHGSEGRGDGPLGRQLARPASDLRKGSFWLVPYGPAFGSEAEGLARVIKFGIPGTSMPGHEYFSDQEIADLAAFVGRLAATPLEDARVASHTYRGLDQEVVD